jgi:hypothetical protein
LSIWLNVGRAFPVSYLWWSAVVDAGEHDFSDYMERITIGKEPYISPSEIQKLSLPGQNTLSEEISRLQAQSLQFLAGFTILPWNMKTAVKISELPGRSEPAL